MLTITYSYAGQAAKTISLADNATAKQQTAAIQSALDAVASHGGGAVALSADTFTLVGTAKASDGCLRIGSNTEFSGAGMGATVLKLAEGSTAVTGMIRTSSGQVLPDGTVTTTSNVNVHDLTVNGNKANTTGNVDGFYCGPKPGTAQADINVTLDHVEIMNVSRYGFDPHEQTTGLTISNSVAHHNGVDGFTIDFCNDVHLTNNTAYANGRHGFNIVTGSYDVTLTGNNAYGNGGSGIAVQTGDNELREWTHSVTIFGGSISGNGRDGISVKQTADVSIAGVTIDGNGGHGVSLAGVRGANLEALLFSNVGSGSEAIRLTSYVQDFSDSDPLNDRYIATTGVFIAGTEQTAASSPGSVTPWNWVVTAGDDAIAGSAGRDVIAAGSGNDSVVGAGGDDVLYGNDGNDILDGGAGNDKLYGGLGNDTLRTGEGVDLLDGGAGFDTVDFSKFASAITVNLGAASPGVWAAGTLIANLVSIEGAKGGSYADTLSGDDRNNTLDGAGGFDNIAGGKGDDTINGAAGNDTLSGGLGNDALTGGTGSDIFQFQTGWGVDTVADFYRTRDKLDVTAVTSLDKFSDIVITQAGSDTQLAFSGNSIVLAGVSAATITASDFLFH